MRADGVAGRVGRGRGGIGRGGRRLLAGACLAALAGCAPSLQHEHVDPQTLTQAQFDGAHFHNAYEAVQALRSNWLNARPMSPNAWLEGGVQVYMDNVRLGGLSELQAIPMSTVVYIRHFDALQATERWGLNHTQGVIFVSTHPVQW